MEDMMGQAESQERPIFVFGAPRRRLQLHGDQRLGCCGGSGQSARGQGLQRAKDANIEYCKMQYTIILQDLIKI